jgi:hypothetical protein
LNAPTNTNPDDQKRIDDALAALRRAKRRAEDLAIATGTELVEADSDGKVVLLTPAEIIARRDKATTPLTTYREGPSMSSPSGSTSSVLTPSTA